MVARAVARHELEAVPRREVRGMQRLMEMARRGDPALTALLSAPELPAFADLTPAPLVIEPLTIAPLATDSD
jgi:hypothetical protein